MASKVSRYTIAQPQSTKTAVLSALVHTRDQWTVNGLKPYVRGFTGRDVTAGEVRQALAELHEAGIVAEYVPKGTTISGKRSKK